MVRFTDRLPPASLNHRDPRSPSTHFSLSHDNLRPPALDSLHPVTVEQRASADSLLNSLFLTNNFGGLEHLLVGEGDIVLGPGVKYHAVDYSVVDFDVYDKIPPAPR